MNTYPADLVQRFVNEIDKHEAEISSSKAENAAFCKGRLEMIRKLKKSAQKAGIAKAHLNAFLDVRKAHRKLIDLCEDVSWEDRPGVEQIADAMGVDFGTTPLGLWAGEKAETRSDELDEMTADDSVPSAA